jgi:hypothetical protein
LGISIFLDMILFICILFLVKKKKFHYYQYLFVFLSMVFLYSSFISTIHDNLELWKVKEKASTFAVFRITEIILFPLLPLWFIEMFYFRREFFYRTFVAVIFLIIPVVLEKWLIYLNIISYKDWQSLFTIVTWIVFYIVTLLIHIMVGKQLKKEGIRDDTSIA